jgi:hypothetical protein
MRDFRNLAIGVVETAPSPASSGLTLVLQAGHGARFPPPPFPATVWPSNELPDPTNAEIVTVSAISGDTVTIVRAAEDSILRLITCGDAFASTVTAAFLSTVPQVTDALTSWTGSMAIAGSLTPGSIQKTTLYSPTLAGYAVKWQNPSIGAGGVLTFSYLDGNHVVVTVNQNITGIVITNVPTDAIAEILISYISDGGSRSVTHTIDANASGAAAVKFPDNLPPVMTNTAGYIDRVRYTSWAPNTLWLGDIIGLHYGLTETPPGPPPAGTTTITIDGGAPVAAATAGPFFFTVGTHTFVVSAPVNWTLYGTAGGGGASGGLRYLGNGEAGGGGGGGGATVAGMTLNSVDGRTYTVVVGAAGAGVEAGTGVSTDPGDGGAPTWVGFPGGNTVLSDNVAGNIVFLGGGQGGWNGVHFGGVAGRGYGGAGGVVSVGTNAANGGAGGDGSGTEWRPDVGTAGSPGAVISGSYAGAGGGGGGGRGYPAGGDKLTLPKAGLAGGTSPGIGVAGGVGGARGSTIESAFALPTVGQGGNPYWGTAGTVNPYVGGGGSGGGGTGMTIPGFGYFGGGGGAGGGPGDGGNLTTTGGSGQHGAFLMVFLS